MQTFIKKITSRKFLTCVAGIVIGLCTMFGIDENAVSTISGAVIAVGSITTYIMAEGKVDAAAVKNAAEKVTEATDVVEKIEE